MTTLAQQRSINTLQLIPAIDLRHGQVVRLAQGDADRQTDYALDPRQVLARYGAAGVELVHVVDLDAAFGEPPQRALIEELARLGPAIELGGGLRDAEGVGWALGAGCARVIIGSLVARDTEAFATLARRFPGQVVPAIEGQDGEVKVAGWRERSGITIDALASRLLGLPCPAVLVTDVARDGMMTGPNVEMACRVARLGGLPAIVSGGVCSLDDLRAARQPGIGAVIVGKALYEGQFDLADALAVCRGDSSGDGRGDGGTDGGAEGQS